MTPEVRQLQRVLVIDDEPHVLEGLRRILHPLSHVWDLTCTTNGQEALALLARTPFDIVVTDLLMPAPDGLEVLLELRRRFPAVKVVVMSGGNRWGTVSLLDIAHKLGAAGILAKPFRPQTFIEPLRDVALSQEALAPSDITHNGTQS